MPRSRKWYGWLAIGFVLPASAGSLDVATSFTLRLDSHDYVLPAGRLYLGISGTITLAPQQYLTGCARAGGGPLPQTPFRLIHDGLGRSLYLTGPLLPLQGAMLELRTSGGDVRCAGGTPADALFDDGFE